MFGLGMSEIIFLAVLALIVIGPKQLPEVARTLGRFLNDIKRSTNDLSQELKTQTRFDEFNIRDSIMKEPTKPPTAPPSNVMQPVNKQTATEPLPPTPATDNEEKKNS
jgi:Tat protein translocase TatB subunit